MFQVRGTGPQTTEKRSLFLNRPTHSPNEPQVHHEPANQGRGQHGDKARRPGTHTDQAMAFLELVKESLEDDQAEDIISIDLESKTPIADFMVIANGRSQRHVGAIADHLTRRIKEAGYGTARIEGMPQCDWVLVDSGDIIIHIFRPEVRGFYQLEKMWAADIPADSHPV